MKNFITLAICAATIAPAALNAAGFGYNVTNNTLQGVNMALYESNSPGSYTLQQEQLIGASAILILTNSVIVPATNGIVVQFTNLNSFASIGYLSKISSGSVPGGTLTGCNLSVLLTNYFTRINLSSSSAAAPTTNSSGAYSPAAPTIQPDPWALTASTATNLGGTVDLIGSTNLFYSAMVASSDTYSPSAVENMWIGVSANPTNGWSLPFGQQPSYITPNLLATNEATGPGNHQAAVMEQNGALYMVYCADSEGQVQGQAGTKPGVEGAALDIVYSDDLHNWRQIGNWQPNGLTNSTGITNESIGNPGWSQVNYGGTNWIIYSYMTNTTVAQDPGGIIYALPVTFGATRTNIVFGNPVAITVTTNMCGAGLIGTILTNNAGLYILPGCQGTGVPVYCSANFLGPYVAETAWNLPYPSASSMLVLNSPNYPYGQEWFIYGGNGYGLMEWSTNYGTNWGTSVSSFQALNPMIKSGQWILYNEPFILTTPLTNDATVLQAADGYFSSVVAAPSVNAQNVKATSISADNIICGGVVSGTYKQPWYVHGSFNSGSLVTNLGTYCVAEGVGVFVGPDAFGSMFFGSNYYSDDGQNGVVFEFEDGGMPVNSPLASAPGGGFYFNGSVISNAQAVVQSQCGFSTATNITAHFFVGAGSAPTVTAIAPQVTVKNVIGSDSCFDVYFVFNAAMNGVALTGTNLMLVTFSQAQPTTPFARVDASEANSAATVLNTGPFYSPPQSRTTSTCVIAIGGGGEMGTVTNVVEVTISR